jgi:drug/metabolite transporter (DMT)-like permease
MNRPLLKDYLLLHLCIVFWGFTSVLGVLSSLQAPYLVVYRTGLAFLTLYAILRFSNYEMRFPWKSVGLIALAGFLTAFHWTTFFASAQVSNVSTCLAGMSTTALWTSLLEPLMTNKKFRWLELVLAGLVSVGLVLIYRSDLSMAYGLSISLVSAIACSVFSILNRKLVLHHSPLLITTWEMGFAWLGSLLALPLLFWLGSIPTISLPLPGVGDWLNIFFLAWVCTVFAYTMSVELMKKFTAFSMNLTVNLEPVYGIFLGLLIFGSKEKMQPMFYVGLLLILGGVFIFPFLEHRGKKVV